MSTPYFSWTVPIQPDALPANLTPDGGNLPDEIGHAMGHADAICTSSRNDWLHGMLRRVFDTLGGPTLAFLVKDPDSLPNIDAAAFQPVPVANSPLQYQEVWVVTKLSHADLMPALREIEGWFERITEAPASVPGLFDSDCRADEVSSAIHDAVDLRGGEAPGDDGDFAWYLFCFLRSLQALLQEAWASDSAVVHVRCTYVFRTMGAA